MLVQNMWQRCRQGRGLKRLNRNAAGCAALLVRHLPVPGKKRFVYLCVPWRFFLVGQKGNPSQCLCSWQLATEAQSITRLTPFKKQPAGIELDGTYNKQQNENNKQQAVGITS
jgi:hypothetical protein